MASKSVEKGIMAMKRQIEQEIDQTLNCLGENSGIEVSDLFVDAVSSKICLLQTRRGIGYQNKAFYPVVIVLMVVFNFAILAASITPRQATAQTDDPMSVIASEYGIGQEIDTAF